MSHRLLLWPLIFKHGALPNHGEAGSTLPPAVRATVGFGGRFQTSHPSESPAGRSRGRRVVQLQLISYISSRVCATS